MGASRTSKNISKHDKTLFGFQILLTLANVPQFQSRNNSKNLWLVLVLILASFLSHSLEVSAQITPDNTLPNNSIATPDGNSIEITGGTTRGTNLFHSFQNFSVLTGQTAFFNNGLTIENILTRVTGSSISNIDGIIRANGGANLFLINPNGIIFGENASLDIGGSFVATTADGIKFGEDGFFSASDSQSSQLLTVKPEVFFENALANYQGTIVNQGNLAVVEDLSLSAGNLDLQGQLQAGKDLTLQADTIQIRDTQTNPFIAAAGDRLLIQGNQSVDIFALNNPDSGLFSGGDMILSSANPVVGDIHFWSGGNFEIKKLDNNKGHLFSFYDPIIRSQGDVSIFAYQGASLHILAGGKVDINTVVITNPDTIGESINPAATPNLANITLSDDTALVIDGSQQPTLDIRAGVEPAVISDPLGTLGDSGTFFNSSIFPVAPPSNNPVATSADITIGDVSITAPDGTILLTNQYEPNLTLQGGNINVTGNGLFGIGIDASGFGGDGSDVFLDSRGDITLNSAINASALSESDIYFGDGGNITLLADSNIDITSSAVLSSDGLLGGNIIFKSGNDISITNNVLIFNANRTSNQSSSSQTGGLIDINAGKSVLISQGSELGTFTLGTSNTGNVNIQANESLSLTQGGRIQAVTFADGNAGSIAINSQSVELKEGGRIEAVTLADGNAGSIAINSQSVELTGNNPVSGISSGLFSSVGLFGIGGEGGAGNGGNITIVTDSLRVTNGGRISADLFGTNPEATAGSIDIKANSIEVIGLNSNNNFLSGIFTAVTPFSKGNAGNINVETATLLIQDGGLISASTFGEGDAGSVTVKANSIDVIGVASSGSPSTLRANVALNEFIGSRGIGNSGNLTIETETLRVADGAQILANTEGDGNGGIIEIKAQSVELSGFSDSNSNQEFPTGVFSGVEEGAVGTAGSITIETNSIELSNGAFVSANTDGEGTAGNIEIKANTLEAIDGSQIATNTTTNFDAADIILDITRNLSLSGKNSGLFAQTEAAGNAGNIRINTPELTIDREASISAFTQSAGDGGTITVDAPQSVLITNQGKLTVETSGAGKPGDITITTPNLTIGRDAEISATATQESTNTEGSGSITVNASKLDLTGKLGIFAETQGETPAGTLNIQPDNNKPNLDIQFTDTAIISASTTASGKGGDINLTAPETININGQGKVAVETRGEGDAGSINITTQNFNISDRTEISASTFSSGKAGDINITANNFNLREGATVITNTASSGQAGDIRLNVKDNLNLISSNIEASTTSNSTGRGGNINIDPQSVLIQNGSTIAVNSDGKGQGGDITLAAKELTLDRGSITAETASNQGGNITLDVGDILRFENSGKITASAGTTREGGDGGNVNIDANFILAFPTDNNYAITANAFEGKGGNIQITTNSFFGSEFVDISVSSQFGLDGDVSVEVLEIDPAKGLTQLTTQVVDVSQLIAKSCLADGKENEFLVTGRGGLPPNPHESLRGEAVLSAEWLSLPQEEARANQIKQPAKLTTTEEIVEAKAWFVGANGNIVLTANPSQSNTFRNPWIVPYSCTHSSRQ